MTIETDDIVRWNGKLCIVKRMPTPSFSMYLVETLYGTVDHAAMPSELEETGLTLDEALRSRKLTHDEYRRITSPDSLRAGSGYR